MVSFLTSKDKDMELIFPDACLIVSLLNWKVDIDSKEGKDLDKYFKELINNYLKKYDYSIKSLLSYFAKYIINIVNVATELLREYQFHRKSYISEKMLFPIAHNLNMLNFQMNQNFKLFKIVHFINQQLKASQFHQKSHLSENMLFIIVDIFDILNFQMNQSYKLLKDLHSMDHQLNAFQSHQMLHSLEI